MQGEVCRWMIGRSLLPGLDTRVRSRNRPPMIPVLRCGGS